MQTLTQPTAIAEQGNRIPVHNQVALTNMDPRVAALASRLANSPPRPQSVFPAGSVVITSVDDGSVRVIDPATFSTMFESAPEGGGSFRVKTPAFVQTVPAGGTFITTNSDGTVNVGQSANGDLLQTNAVTGETRAVSRLATSSQFEVT